MTLALCWAAVAFAASLNWGMYWEPGFWLLVLAAVAVYLPPGLLGGRRVPGELTLWGLALGSASVALAASLLWAADLRVPALRIHAAWAEPWIAAAQLLTVLAILAYARPVRARLGERAARWRFRVVFASSAVAGALAILSFPSPPGDVYNAINEGARGLLAGRNPYALQFTPLDRVGPGFTDPAFNFDVYAYLPGTLLLTIPGVLLGDARWAMLAALLASALLLRAVALCLRTPEATAELVVAAYLSYPGLLLVLQINWVDPLTVAFWLAALWAQLAARTRWSLALASVALSIKQYNPLLLIPLLPELPPRRLLLSFLAPVAIALPFVLWSPRDFWWDAVWFHIAAAPREDALSLNGYLLHATGASLPGWLSALVPAAGVAYALWRVGRRCDVAEALRLTAGAYLLVFLFNKLAFANYYYFVQAVLLVALAAAHARPERALRRVDAPGRAGDDRPALGLRRAA